MGQFEDGQPGFRLSARAWDSLIGSAAEVRDLLDEDNAILLEDEGNSTTAVVALMPRRFSPRYDRDFVERLAATATGLLKKIRSARREGWAYPYETFLNSVAEEMLMARIIDLAKQKSSEPSVLEELEELDDASFEDRDFEWLYDLRHDGVTDDPGFVEQLGFANLKFEDWFSPFRPEGQQLSAD